MTKQEKQEIRERYEIVYGNSAKMVDYCTNSVFSVWKFRDGIVPVKKEKIKTNFCFGYSDSKYDTEDYDRANRLVEIATENQQYFIKQNHKNAGYAAVICLLGNKDFYAYACPRYDDNSGIYGVYFRRVGNSIPQNAVLLTTEERDEYRKILAEACKAHHKKIMTYLKRYGLTKVNAWSYWQDR